MEREQNPENWIVEAPLARIQGCAGDKERKGPGHDNITLC